MANNLLTPQIITNESLRILHSNLNFIGNINRQYDNRFARNGAKIGSSLDVRLPNKYTVRDGPTLNTQDTVNRKVTLPVATQKGVDVNFSSQELTMDLNDFSQNILQPAMAQLASRMEADALSMRNSVANLVGTPTGHLDYATFQGAGRKLTENLAPMDNSRTFTLDPKSRVDFSDAVKGLFQSADAISEQYREGVVGKTGGFNVYENTLLSAHTPGTLGGTPLVNGASQGNAGTNNAYVDQTNLVTDGWTASQTVLTNGDVFTIAGVYEVHPETKHSYGTLKQFAVVGDTASDASGNATVTVSPGIITGGAYQNVSAAPADNAAITPVGSASTPYGENLAFHKDAFIFASADLEDVSQYGAWGARKVYDGLSMRIARQYDINNDQMPCRIDVLYGYVPAYPELATRVIHST